MRRRRRLLLGAAVLAAVTGGALGGLGGVTGLVGTPERASAHDFLVSTTPAADDVVTGELDTVSLTFNAPPLADGAAAIAIEVRDPSGANIVTGAVSIVDSTLSVAVAPTAVGAHQVLWQTVSSDGHPVSGEFAFDYEGPAVAPSAASSPTPSATATVTAAPTPTPSSAAALSEAGSSRGTGGGVTPLVWVGVASAAGVLAVVLVAALLVARRRSASARPVLPAEPTDPEEERRGERPRP